MTGSRYLLIPVLNKAMSFARTPSLELGGSAILRTIKAEHFGELFEQTPDRYRYAVSARTKCIYASLDSPELTKIGPLDIASTLRFALNFFSSRDDILFLFCLEAEQKRKLKVKQIYDIASAVNSQELRETSYKLREDVSPADLKAYISTIFQAATLNRSLLIAISRINSASWKSRFDDQLVDFTIGLESLIPFRDELKFRFSLYLSFISESDPDTREKAFALFQALYDTRSSVVHTGELGRKSKTVEENWSEIKRLGFAAVNYYALFLTGSKGDWAEHLQSLVIRGATRITDQ